MRQMFVRSAKGVAPDAGLIVDACRTWRLAQDANQPVQPSLFAAMDPRSEGVLAPVFDSLMTLYESVLGRSMRPGGDASLSDDENLLLDLLSGTRSMRPLVRCAEGVATAFEAALRSTRIMLRLAGNAPDEGGAVLA